MKSTMKKKKLLCKENSPLFNLMKALSTVETQHIQSYFKIQHSQKNMDAQKFNVHR